MTRIYTRTGDGGETGLIGGQRVSKDHLRVEAYGTLDELNSALGAARAVLEDSEVASVVEQIQHSLFALGAEIASPAADAGHIPRCTSQQVEALEAWIDHFEAALPPLRAFILPGGNRVGSLLHLARTISRRAERRIVTLAGAEALNPEILRYLNRLSDLLFVLARTVNHRSGIAETVWRKHDG
jgi:cob(I)alamin adenosyltransferase